MICENCFFAEKEGNNLIHCTLWDYYRGGTIENCSDFMSKDLKCYKCNKKKAEWMVHFKDGTTGFICDKCRKKKEYNDRFPIFRMSEVEPKELYATYIRNLKDNNKTTDQDRKERIDSLSDKEKQVYSIMQAFNGGVLIRSLNKVERGCLGALVSKHLGEITSVILNYKRLKMFKLTGE